MRILLAGIVGGIVMFIWTSIAHMALPLREAGINEIPNDSAVLSAMQSSIGDKHENLFRQSPRNLPIRFRTSSKTGKCLEYQLI